MVVVVESRRKWRVEVGWNLAWALMKYFGNCHSLVWVIYTLCSIGNTSVQEICCIYVYLQHILRDRKTCYLTD